MRRRSLLLMTFLLIVISLGSLVTAQDPQTALFNEFVFDARADLELLANLVLGEGVRPPDWTFNADVNSNTMVADLWFDNEQLADAVFGVQTRPPDWLGALGSTRPTIARNTRHDLELTADHFLGAGVRPPEWRGSPPILRCSRTLQNLLDVLGRFYNVVTTTPESAFNYCQAVAAEVEDELIEAVFSPERLAQLSAEMLAIRGDLERLADERLGLNNRPANWIGNRDQASPTLTADTFLDLETLADTLLGQGQRPIGWQGGPIATNPAAAFQNMRHDLEVLANETLGINVRPTGWQGIDPLSRCDPQIQNLYFLVRLNYDFTPTGLDPASPDYCLLLASAVNQAAENPPALDVVEPVEGEERLMAESNFAFAYLDVGATLYMGIMPGGTPFRAWYRNFGDSNMMFVSGDNFALYVDYRFTTLPALTFDSLPTLEGVAPQTFCNAPWCSGPGPTPTPTGFGPLAAVLNEATPPAPTAQATAIGGGTQGKVQVSWNNIRVTYVLDNPGTRMAQVALEICALPATSSTACEPVTSVVDLTTNTAKQPLGVYNGLNIYEFPYGYSTQLLIEGAAYFSNDIWISDPTIR